MGRSRFALGVLVVVWLLGLVAAAVWSMQAQAIGWRHALAFAAVALGGVFALIAWLRSPRGTLAWDGEAWYWTQGGLQEPGAPEVALDLQSRLLLRWRSEAGRVRWLTAERDGVPADWDALRRAVYSPASTGAPQGATPPVAER